MKQATLCFLVDSNNGKPKVLLGMKKRGFGKGKWNGFGGKPAENESIEQAALRELKEEAIVETTEKELQKMAEIDFVFSGKPDWNQLVHVFVAKKWTGIPKETEEMKPQWFETKKIPFHQMWQDDLHWLPIVLNGKKIKAAFLFKEDNETIQEFNIRETGKLE